MYIFTNYYEKFKKKCCLLDIKVMIKSFILYVEMKPRTWDRGR